MGLPQPTIMASPRRSYSGSSAPPVITTAALVNREQAAPDGRNDSYRSIRPTGEPRSHFSLLYDVSALFNEAERSRARFPYLDA